MIIFYGVKSEALDKKSAGVLECPHCFQGAQVLAVACVNYMHIFWIPMFGWKSPVYVCLICKNALSRFRFKKDFAGGIPAEARAAYKTLASRIRIPWYYFSGSVLFLAALTFLFWLAGH